MIQHICLYLYGYGVVLVQHNTPGRERLSSTVGGKEEIVIQKCYQVKFDIKGDSNPNEKYVLLERAL